MWTQFWDMHSGGSQKEEWSKIYIEAPEKEAKIIFYNRFGHNPERVTCTCCGEDYSLSEEDSLEQITAYHRNCDFAYFDKNHNEVSSQESWETGKGHRKGYYSKYIERQRSDGFGEYVSLDQYIHSKDALVIFEKDIKPDERFGDVPEQGYVWVD